MRQVVVLGALAAAVAWPSTPAIGEEGMFTPDQLPQLRRELREAGLRMRPRRLSDLTAFPMGAIVSLGGCSASFVSPTGLVATNHHCARGSVQFNSTEENNYLEDGFFAPANEDEPPAAPGSRIYVTVDVADVTDQITSDLDPDLAGRDRFEAIDQRRKAAIADCEEDPGHRCEIGSFFGGLTYKLIKRLEIRDVRLVYAPADAIGKYGGDIDNWRWPRHTGDFAFYRAYVDPDGQPAEYAPENVPFQPEHFLKVSAAGLENGDFVMAAGYPGSTQRYARLTEVRNTFDWLIPTYIDILDGWIATIEAASPEGSDARLKYEPRLAGLNNVLKNFDGQIEGARRVDLIGRREARETALDAWIAEDSARAPLGDAVERVDAVAEKAAAAARRDFWYNNATRPQLLNAAQRLYRLSKERQKPDAERETDYQERDMAFFEQSLQAIDRRYDPAVDEAEWRFFLERYLAAPQDERVAAFDAALGLEGVTDAAGLGGKLARYYADTTLDDIETRLSLMTATPDQLEGSQDPFMRLAVALYDTELEQEEAAKARAGESAAARPGYMLAIIAWQQEQGQVAYPDANSTLRVTYGSVVGGSPQDGLIYEPFTRLEGINAKHTNEDPFDAPDSLLALIEEKAYGPFALESIGSVPVNFLSNLDATGGNSGSATLNARGELVGLLFDGTIESVNSDWDFDPRTTRTIHVDSRYMLWVMENVDGAQRLIDEMTIVR